MDPAIIQRAGLTESQAKGYLALIEHGSLTPSKAAELINETRTNTYAVFNKLVELGLATKDETSKITFTANHPAALEALAEKRRRIVSKNEVLVKQNIGALVDMYYAATETPGTRTLYGIEGIKEVYQDMLRNKQPAIALATKYDVEDLPLEFFKDFQHKRAAQGGKLTLISSHAINAVEPKDDEKMLLSRRRPRKKYDAPVEISVYGNKVSFIAFGETQIATIIDSPPVAEAMRQVLEMI